MKPVNVAFLGEAAEEWENLNRIVAEENEKGIRNSESQQILKSIKQKIEMIKINPQYGDSVSKKLLRFSITGNTTRCSDTERDSIEVSVACIKE